MWSSEAALSVLPWRRLVGRGFDVTVIDRTGICDETSSGNAAALAFSDILPLAQKGMIGRSRAG
jgi:hypothetical protein